jgi:hypothetical protein
MTPVVIDADLVLIVISGVAWTIVYFSAIWIGFRHKTYAMPVAALALNLAWESIYAPQDLKHAFAVPGIIDSDLFSQGVISVVWVLADFVIVYTFFRFGRTELAAFLSRRLFVIWALVLFATAYAVQWLFIVEFGATEGSRYSAFLQNLLMSGLFIAMLVARKGLRGQTLTIAIAKWIGTLAATILYGGIERSTFILGLGIMCSVFDLVYIGLVIWAKRHKDALGSPVVAPVAEPVAVASTTPGA